MKKIKCGCCGLPGVPYARGLRRSCYERLRAAGTLNKRFPRLIAHMSSDDRYELLLEYRDQGLSDRKAFELMGQDPDYLYAWRKRRREKDLPI